MKLKLKKLKFEAGRPIVFIHENTAKRLDSHAGDRVQISYHNKKAISIIDTVNDFIKEDEISFSKEMISYFKVKSGVKVEVSQILEPASLEIISKKMNGRTLTKKEIYTIVNDIVNNALSEAEISFFVLSAYERGMSFNETVYLTEAMCKTGQSIKWPANLKIADKHSIGGIPGNRTTPIIVSICAAAGIIMPKTSSRAITSAAGTADAMESIAKVDFSIREIKKIVSKSGACLAWGGSLGLAPADDKLIKVERLLNLDPESQLIASIISKKLAAGSKYVLIDVPYGFGAKVAKSRAEKLKNKFLKIGKHFGLNMKIALTDGSQPIGNGIGPVLEMIEVIKVLKRENSSQDLEKKALYLSGEILELTGKAGKNKGVILAKEILDSKQALRKFEEIIKLQGKKKGGLKLAKFSYKIKANKQGTVKSINNKGINHLARLLGCPVDKSSGIYLHKHKYDSVRKEDVLVTFYSESQKKLKEAINHFYLENPFIIG